MNGNCRNVYKTSRMRKTSIGAELRQPLTSQWVWVTKYVVYGVKLRQTMIKSSVGEIIITINPDAECSSDIHTKTWRKHDITREKNVQQYEYTLERNVGGTYVVRV